MRKEQSVAGIPSKSAILVWALVGVCVWPEGAFSQNAPDLVGTSWQLVQFQGGDGKTLVPADRSRYTVAFDKQSVNLQVDCNRGHGTWKSVRPNQLEFGPLALTRAMCPAAELNARIPQDWGAVRSYVRKDGHLFLSLMADGGTYEFEPAAERDRAKPGSSAGVAAAPVTLENTVWVLTKVGNTTVAPGHGPRIPHLILNSEAHRAGGSGGCNGLMGTYEVDGDRLAFPGMASTRLACKQGMETESAFLKALNQVKLWRITGRKLELMDGDGKVLAELENPAPNR
jgi:heat shock protein HslJ